MIGLDHGHVSGFFRKNQTRTDIQIVGIAEPNKAVADRYAGTFHFTNPDALARCVRRVVCRAKDARVPGEVGEDLFLVPDVIAGR